MEFTLANNLANIPHNTPLTAGKQLLQMGTTDLPRAMTQKVQLQSSDIRTWNTVCEEDVASGSSSSGRGSSFLSHQHVNDRRSNNCHKLNKLQDRTQPK